MSVMLFFILSGFVIGRTHREPWSPLSVKNYLVKRFVRLYPIYLIAVIVSFLVVGYSLRSKDFIAHLLFLQGTVAPLVKSDLPLWSLTYEVFYYGLFLAIWRFPRAFNLFIGLSLLSAMGGLFSSFILIKMMALFSFWLFGCWLARTDFNHRLILDGSGRFWLPLILYVASASSDGWLDVAKHLTKNPERFGWVLNFLGGGPLIAEVFLSVLRKRLVAWIAWPAYLLAGIVAVGGIAVCFATGQYHEQPGYFGSLVFLIAAVVMAMKRLSAPVQSFWIKFSPLGGISYALYVLHMPMLFFCMTATRTKALIVIESLGAIVLAILLSWVLERKMQPVLTKAMKVRRAHVDSPAAVDAPVYAPPS